MIYKTRILENIRINDEINSIIVEKPSLKEKIKPGCFFNIKSESDYPLLRRPISVGLVNEDNIIFFIRRHGQGTRIFCEKKKGDYLEIMGPLGNGFDLKKTYKSILLVGGGIGVAPLLELARHYSLVEDVKVKGILGFKEEAFLIDEYKKYIEDLVIVSEDKDCYDYKGLITTPLIDEINSNRYDVIYTCGPKPMLKAVAKTGNDLGIDVQLLMEERMACGIGACLVCACKVKRDDDWTFLRTCKEGPVFFSREVIFDD